MEVLHLPDNIKFHYAGVENLKFYQITHTFGVNYFLYTAYPFVSELLKSRSSIEDIDYKHLRHLSSNCKHVIQDSGLFTLMFGAMKGKKDAALMNKWYDNLVNFTLACNNGATVVEIDCQKVLGVEAAWEFRKRMRKDLPKSNRIINVFHLEDGMKGLDRLIDFSEYIAISVPELRFAGKSNYVGKIARYIKKRKPTIDIHLLGCTEKDLLKQNTFCTSADSTSWLSSVRYGFIKQRHIRNIKTEKIIQLIGEERYKYLLSLNFNQNYLNALPLGITMLKKSYQDICGNQDYYK